MNRTPSWLSTEDDRLAVEIHHVWKPRPMGRSILWTPIGPARQDEPTGSYEVFVEQRTLETMYRHVWGADPDEEPFGYLFGDLCEDRESRIRYVIITRAVASAYPLLENESDQIADEAARALRSEVRSNDRVLAGWYHRHREGPARLSAEDAATHRAHFAEPWQVAFLFVTDPDEPAGGCFRPRIPGGTARALIPFHELAGAASLLAKGVCRTRIDWENVETRTEVIVEALPRPEVPRATPEPAFEDDESGTESVDDAIDAGASEPEPVTAVALIEEEKPVQPAPVADEARIEETPFDEEPVAPEPVATEIRILYELSGSESVPAADRDMESPRQTARAQPVSGPDLVIEHEVALSTDSQVESDVSAELAHQKAEKEASRQAAELEAARLAVEEEARRHAEELKATLAAAQQARQAVAEEAAHRTAELEAAETARQAAAEEAARHTAELEAARRQAQEEAEEQAAELQATLDAAEAARQAAEDAAAWRTAELEAARKAAEEESERQAAEAAAAIRAAEEEAARQAADAHLARKAAEQKAALLRTEEAARSKAEGEAETSPTPPPPGADRARRWGLDAAVDGVLVAAAVACIVVGALPLRYGTPTTIDQPGLTAALAGFVMPARAPAPALEPVEERDPLALLGRDLRATIGRYHTIAGMFAKRRLACAPLREAYIEVDEGWTAYSIALARKRDGLAEGLAFRHESVYREVQEAEADFTASGCNRP